ncbi:cupin domain-containing protein [Pseudomonas sp. NFXW11]
MPQVLLPLGLLAAALLAAMTLATWNLERPHPALIAGQHATHSNPAAARPQTQIKPLSCQPLSDMPGKVVTTLLVDFPPGAHTPAHRHPGSVTAFVVKGQVRSQMQGSPAQTYSAGETWYEAKGELHSFAENPSSTEPAQLLTVFVSDENCGPLVIPEPG